MGRFSGVENARVSEGGVYFNDGNYLVQVDAVKEGESRKKEGFFVVENTILWSDCPSRKAGSSVSWMTMEKNESFLGNVKGFVSVAAGILQEEVTEEGIEMIVSDENPLRGTILRVEAVTIQTRKGTDFTKVTFKPLRPEDVAKLKGLGIEVPDGNPVEE